MPFLISDSAVPLLMETVPVLKIRYYYGSPTRDAVYAYVRLFACKGALHVCMTVFDGEAPEDMRFGLALQSADCLDTFLLLSAGPAQGSCTLTAHDAQTGAVQSALDAPRGTWVRGGDEQGWFWSMQTVIPSTAFAGLFGTSPKAGGVYAGNAFLYRLSEDAFGAAFPVPAGAKAPCSDGFDALPIVPY